MSNFARIVGIVVAFWGFSKHTFAQELFGDENVITARTAGHSPYFAADLDGDCDTDVLSASLFDNKIAWSENTNILGQRVRTFVKENLEAGIHKMQWDGKDKLGRNLTSGVYIYRIDSGNFAQSHKLVLLR